MAQPERIAIVGHDHVEGAVGAPVEIGQRLRGGTRVGMVERLQHQFAARAQPGGRAERALPVEHGGDDAIVVETEPAAAGKIVATRDDARSFRPVPPGRRPGTVGHFVAVGADHHRPCVARTQQSDERAHGAF